MIWIALALTWVGGLVMALLDGRGRAVWLAVGLLGASFTTLLVLAVGVFADGPVERVAGGWPAGVGIALRADALGVVFAVLSTGVLLAALTHEALSGIDSRRFPALVLFMATGLTGLFLTRDVFNFYVFFELSMIAAYALSTYGEESPKVGAAFVFAVVNLLGSFLFLIAVASLYQVTGTLYMDEVARRIAESGTASALLIGALVLVAFSVKLGLFPFHFWLPTIYIRARPSVSAILSGALANIGSYGVLRFGADILPAQLRAASWVLIVLGTASIVYGAVQALSRRASAEMLAYSAIGQVGYVLIALGVGGPVGVAAAILYAIVNALNKALLFLSTELRGWMVGAVFAVGAFSVAGVPPAAGFLGKLALFRTGIEAGSALLVALIFIGGALSFVYMFQVYQNDFWAGQREGDPTPLRTRAVAYGLAAVVLALGAWPQALLAISRDAARALMGAA